MEVDCWVSLPLYPTYKGSNSIGGKSNFVRKKLEIFPKIEAGLKFKAERMGNT
jgi:hypothetical protein